MGARSLAQRTPSMRFVCLFLFRSASRLFAAVCLPKAQTPQPFGNGNKVIIVFRLCKKAKVLLSSRKLFSCASSTFLRVEIEKSSSLRGFSEVSFTAAAATDADE